MREVLARRVSADPVSIDRVPVGDVLVPGDRGAA
jgi:hypothetical protein